MVNIYKASKPPSQILEQTINIMVDQINIVHHSFYYHYLVLFLDFNYLILLKFQYISFNKMRINKLRSSFHPQHRSNVTERFNNQMKDNHSDLLFDDHLICKKEKPKLSNFHTIYLSTHCQKKQNKFQDDDLSVRNYQLIRVHPKTSSIQRYGHIYNQYFQNQSAKKIKNRPSSRSFRIQNLQQNQKMKYRNYQSKKKVTEQQCLQKILIAESLNLHETEIKRNYQANNSQRKWQNREGLHFKRKKINGKDLSLNEKGTESDPLGPWFLRQD